MTLQEELALVTQLVAMYERLSHLRASVDTGGPLRATPPPAAVRTVQGPGDPQGAQGRPHPDDPGGIFPKGPSVQIPMRKVPTPVGPGCEEGFRLEPDLSGADEIIQGQLVRAFEASNPRASESERLAFNASLASKIFETKQQITAMVSGAIDAARQNPEAEKIVGQVRL